MRTAWVLPLILILTALFLVSCSADRKRPQVTGPDEEIRYKDLTKRDHLLYNLQKAYNERNDDEYDRLLDAGFVFHFSEADFREGRVTIEQWDRASELSSARNIFDRNFSKPGVDPISTIDLTLTYTAGDDEWTEVIPEDQVNYPNETWYKKTVRYDLIVKSGPIDYTALNIQASFTVRLAEVSGKNIWRIVAWHDDTESQLAALLAGLGALDNAAADSTWGTIKAMYA